VVIINQVIKVRNASSAPVTLRGLLVQARGPGDKQDTLDFPPVENVTIQPGDTYALGSARNFRNFPEPGTYKFSVGYRTQDGVWHTIPTASGVNDTAQFTVLPLASDRKTDDQLLADYATYAVILPFRCDSQKLPISKKREMSYAVVTTN